MKPGLYFHHHRTLNNGVITFAIEVKDEPRNWVQFSFSLCSPRDKFFKCWGRRISEARLRCERKKHVSGFNAGEGTKLRDMIKKVVTEFYMAVHSRQPFVRMKKGVIPGWVMRAEKKHLKEKAEEVMVDIPAEVVHKVTRGLDALSDPKKEVEAEMAEATT
jgi:hypothetical protein